MTQTHDRQSLSAHGRAAEAGASQLTIRRDRDIFGTDGGWYRARWHFSFDQYYDPQHVGIGMLRVFNHDTLVPGAVWPMHPHRDIEGVTYVVAGSFEHADSLGENGVLEPGGVQRMTLGSGAEHSERNHSQTEPMQFIQMWIMPNRRGLPPGVEQRQHTVEERHNRLLAILGIHVQEAWCGRMPNLGAAFSVDFGLEVWCREQPDRPWRLGQRGSASHCKQC
jgi:redox-sensitive bicupin YhaK (pirin superfamily)